MSQILEKVHKHQHQNMTLIFMIYGTDIGEIYATFGTYKAYIMNETVPMYQFYMILVLF